MSVEIVPVPFDHPDAVELRAAQRRELDERYGSDDHEPGPAPTAEDTPVFLVAYRDGEPVGCGGLRPLDPEVLGVGVAEIKRMFVRAEVRGTGVSTAILRAIEAAAIERGVRRLVLETGEGQPDARRFYEREGYRPIPRFGHYVDDPVSCCYEWAASAA